MQSTALGQEAAQTGKGLADLLRFLSAYIILWPYDPKSCELPLNMYYIKQSYLKVK